MSGNICDICRDKIPDKTRDELVDTGYNFLFFEGKYYSFCPKHNTKEISDFILKKIKKGDEK